MDGDDEFDEMFEPVDGSNRIHQYDTEEKAWQNYVYTIVFIFVWVYERPVKLTRPHKDNLREMWANDVEPAMAASWLADAVGMKPNHNKASGN